MRRADDQRLGTIARRLQEENLSLCEEWLDRLRDFLPVTEYEIFPSTDLLDHIPDLIAAIAKGLERSAGDELSSSIVTAKARELGDLRYGQNASVHQLMREYEHLAEVINEFLIEETGKLADVRAADALDLVERINYCIRVLMRSCATHVLSAAAAHLPGRSVARRLHRLLGNTMSVGRTRAS